MGIIIITTRKNAKEKKIAKIITGLARRDLLRRKKWFNKDGIILTLRIQRHFFLSWKKQFIKIIGIEKLICDHVARRHETDVTM